MSDSIIGKIISEKYYIESYIHEGSMSIVYSAVDISDNSKVIVKGCSHLDALGRTALNNEYKILWKLSCFGIPRVYAYITEGGYDYLVMEYIDGPTLAYIMYNCKISLQEVFTIVSDLCRILIYIHNQSPSVYHCDIKPSNIIVSGDGRAVLIDFGVSVCGAEHSGPCFGTEGYAAPEQFDAHESIDARTDIYSVGILIKHMLKVCEDYNGMPELKNIINRCTNYDAYYRYSDASEILTEIMYITGKEGTVKLLYV